MISCESCIKGEENDLSWYVKKSDEVILRKVEVMGMAYAEEAVRPNEYKSIRKPGEGGRMKGGRKARTL